MTSTPSPWSVDRELDRLSMKTTRSLNKKKEALIEEGLTRKFRVALEKAFAKYKASELADLLIGIGFDLAMVHRLLSLVADGDPFMADTVNHLLGFLILGNDRLIVEFIDLMVEA